MKKKKLFLLIPLAALAVVLVLVYLGRRESDDGSSVRVSGNIEITDVGLSFKIAGRVRERLASEGETVSAGEVIARLESADLEQEAVLRRFELLAARAALAELEAGSRPEEIAAAAAAAERYRAETDYLQVELERQLQLLEKKTISPREYDRSKAEYDGAQARLEESRQRLELIRKGPRRESVEQARAQAERAQAALELAEIRLGYAVLVSPLSGLVLSENIEAGEYVSPGTPVLTVGELENAWLRAYIDETDLGRIKVGQSVRVRTDTYPEKVYPGRVTFISSEAEFTPKNIQTEKERVKLVYRVKIDVPNPELELKPGMPADAEIVVERGTD